MDTAIASKTASQIARLGGSTAVASNLRRVVEELTSLGGRLRYRREWPWLAADDEKPANKLSVSRRQPRFLTPIFAGHDVVSAQLTRAGTAREGREFGMNLEEYLTPVEEVEHMKAALAYYDDQNLWCCFTADDTCGAMRQKRAVATAMAKELISFTRDSEPSSTGTWQTEWPYAVCTGQDGGSNASVVWEYCHVVGVAALPPPSSSSSSPSTTEYEYRVRLRAEPDAAPLTVTKLRVRPKWQREGVVFVQPSRGFGVRTIADARAVLLRHDIPAVAGKLQDYVAVARLKASLENLRVQRQQLLSRQPRAPAERQLFAEHAALAVGDWLAAAPALMPASQLTSVFKSAYTQLGAMCAVEPMRCTPAAFISVPRLTRRQMVQWCVCDCCTWRCGFCSARWDPSPS